MALDAGDTDAALARFDEVRSLGQRFGDVDLAALGTLGRGQAQLSLGQSPMACAASTRPWSRSPPATPPR